LINQLDKKNACIFIYILPFFHQIRGNKSWFERCMTAFLQTPVKVTFAPNIIDGVEEEDDSMLLEIPDWELPIFRAENIWTGKETGW
jgi:hypothetical protein